MKQKKLLCKPNDPKIKRTLTLYETYDKLIVHLAKTQGMSVSRMLREMVIDLVHHVFEERPELFDSLINKQKNENKEEEIIINV